LAAVTPTAHYLRTYGFTNPNIADARGDYITLVITGERRVVSTVDRSGRLHPDFADAALLGADQAAAVARIRAAVAARMAAFPTTITDDMALLGSALPPWRLSATAFRVRFKLTLAALIDRKTSLFVDNKRQGAPVAREGMYEVAVV